MRYIAILVLLTACGSTVPQAVEQYVPPSVVASVNPSDVQDAIKGTTAGLERQVGALRKDIQAASRQSQLVAEAVAREGAKKPSTVIQERVIAVADPVFSGQDRNDLLSRAAAQMKDLKAAAAKIQDLSAQMRAMHEEISALREFTQSPTAFAEKHGVSGILMLIMSIAAFITGRNKKKEVS